MPRTRPDACATLKRSSHRGWLLVNAPIEQVITIYPGPFAVARLENMGVPLKFYWPVFGDFDGAKMLVDAVMSADMLAIARLNARFPEFDFQLGAWFDDLKAQALKAARIIRRTLTSQSLPHGLRLDAELETDTDTGLRTIVQCIYRNRKLVARKVLAEDAAPEQPAAVTAAPAAPPIKKSAAKSQARKPASEKVQHAPSL